MSWINNHHTQDTEQIKKAIEDIGTLAENMNKERNDQVMESQPFKLLFKRSQEYLDHLRNSNGPLSAFWVSYIDLV